MDVRPIGAVQVGFAFLQLAYRARRGSRRIRGLGEQLDPGRNGVVAGAAVVVDRDGGEHHGDGGRCGGGTGQPHGIEIRAQDIEYVLGEHDPAAGRDVGGRCHDQRTVAAVEVAEGRTVEQDLVVIVGGQFGTAPARRHQVSPVARIEGAREKFALDVALEEALLVVVEQLVAVEAVGERGEAAARHAGDDVDGVKQANLGAVRCNDLGAPQELQNAVGERGGSRAAARKGEDDEVFLALEVLLARLKRVTGIRVGMRNRRVDRTGGATAKKEQRSENRGQGLARPLHGAGVQEGEAIASRSIASHPENRTTPPVSLIGSCFLGTGRAPELCCRPADRPRLRFRPAPRPQHFTAARRRALTSGTRHPASGR